MAPISLINWSTAVTIPLFSGVVLSPTGLSLVVHKLSSFCYVLSSIIESVAITSSLQLYQYTTLLLLECALALSTKSTPCAWWYVDNHASHSCYATLFLGTYIVCFLLHQAIEKYICWQWLVDLQARVHYAMNIDTSVTLSILLSFSNCERCGITWLSNSFQLDCCLCDWTCPVTLIWIQKLSICKCSRI